MIFERILSKHRTEVLAGLHDEKCEWRDERFLLCHCSKRRREAEGFTEPLEDLHFPSQFCPRCNSDLEYYGDGWNCETCHTSWDADGTNARFTDCYGDDLAEEVAAWDQKRKAVQE